MRSFNFSLKLDGNFLIFLFELEQNGALILEEPVSKIHIVIEVDGTQLRGPSLCFSSDLDEWIIPEDADQSVACNFVQSVEIEISGKLLAAVPLKVWVYANRESFSDALLVAVGATQLNLSSPLYSQKLFPISLALPLSFEEPKLNEVVKTLNRSVQASLIVTPHPQPRLISRAQEDNGITLEDFSVVSVLGKGSFGEVLLVRERSTNRPYALKSMAKKRSFNSLGNPRILEELRALKPSSQKSPYEHGRVFILQLKYSFQSTVFGYFVTNPILGGSLLELLECDGELDENTTCFYSTQIAFALQYLHSIKVIHRDLKLENILLDINGYAKICDFGLSSFGHSTRKSFCGTRLYMSPEIILQEEYTSNVDWWALGVLMCELLCGQAPFSDSTGIVSREPTLPPSLSDQMRKVILGLLLKNSVERLNFDEFETLKKTEPFSFLDLEGICDQIVIPPFKPYVQHNYDVGNLQGSHESNTESRCRNRSSAVSISYRVQGHEKTRLSSFDFMPSFLSQRSGSSSRSNSDMEETETNVSTGQKRLSLEPGNERKKSRPSGLKSSKRESFPPTIGTELSLLPEPDESDELNFVFKQHSCTT